MKRGLAVKEPAEFAPAYAGSRHVQALCSKSSSRYTQYRRISNTSTSTFRTRSLLVLKLSLFEHPLAKLLHLAPLLPVWHGHRLIIWRMCGAIARGHLNKDAKWAFKRCETESIRRPAGRRRKGAWANWLLGILPRVSLLCK